MTRLRPAQTISGEGLSSLASGLIVATLIIVFLYVGREILEPLVIAVLLGFILAPLIRHLRNLGLWRVPSVILAVLFATAVIGALGSTIVIQAAQLADDLPKYETNLRGLLLAMPLTVCLVVLGRHIEVLEFIEVLLGDEPALEPEERFYQRLLAGDATEAADQAEKQLKEQTLSAYYDSVPMKALALAQADAAHSKLPEDKQLAIRDTMAEIVDDLADYADETSELKEGQPASLQIPVLSNEQLRPDWQVDHPVLCIAGRSPSDEAAAMMLAQLLEKHGLPAMVQPFADVASGEGAQDRCT